METSEKYVLVTVGTSGIGYELAKLFAENGYNLILVARTEKDLEIAAANLKQFDIEVISFAVDLFDYTKAYEIYSALKLNGISPEILVNDAGQGVYGKFRETPIQREIDIINLNIISLVVLTKLFIENRTAKSGKILNLSSIASKAPGPWNSVYHGTKAFVQSFSEAIREELAEEDITVTTLLPGPTATDFFNKANMNQSKILQDKLSDPADVARDGFEALMRGDDKVISGFKNKVQVAMSNLSTDKAAAHRMGEMQKPANLL